MAIIAITAESLIIFFILSYYENLNSLPFRVLFQNTAREIDGLLGYWVVPVLICISKPRQCCYSITPSDKVIKPVSFHCKFPPSFIFDSSAHCGLGSKRYDRKNNPCRSEI